MNSLQLGDFIGEDTVTVLLVAYVAQDFGDQRLFMKEIEHTSKYTSSQCDARGFEVREFPAEAPPGPPRKHVTHSHTYV